MAGAKKNMNNDIQAGVDSVNQYYGQAGAYLSPYTQNAQQDFDTGRNSVYGYGKQQMSNPKYNQQMYSKYLNMSPDELLNQALSGYSMSPLADMQLTMATSALENEMAASGQLGSGTNAAMATELSNAILNQDVSKYLGMEKGAFQTQQTVLKQFNDQSQFLAGLMQDIIGTENKASTSMAQNSMKAAQMVSSLYRSKATQEKNYRPMNNLASIAGAGLEAYLTMGLSTAAKQAAKKGGK